MKRSAVALHSALVLIAVIFASQVVFAAPCALNTTDPSITICTPANGATVASPVNIVAGSTDSAGVIAMAVYVDNNLIQKVASNQISVTVNLANGGHSIVAQLWDNAGRIIKQPENITVSGSSSLPGISFSANPTVISSGQSSTLSWSTTNATSVSIDNGVGSQPTSGTLNVSPSSTTTYTLTATGPGGTSTAKATVTLVSATGCSPGSPAPSVTICSPVNGSTVTSPVHVVAVPNSNNGVIAMAVYFDNVLQYKANVNKVDTLINASTAKHYVVVQYWDNSGNVPAKAAVNIAVSGTGTPAPTASFTASPTTITSGQSSTLTWSTANATSVTIDNGIGSVAASGAQTVSPSSTTTYTLSATGPGGTTTATATVTVSSSNPAPTASFSANPSSITSGQSSTLTWSTTNATSVTIDNGIGTVPASGTRAVSPTQTTTYTLTATGSGGTATAKTTVTVGSSSTCTASGAAPSVTICSPSNGSTITSPVHVVAVPNSNNGVIAMAVYFDNVLQYKASVSKVDTNITATTGGHYVVVQFWDSSGNVPAKASVNITVSNAPPPSALAISPAVVTLYPNGTQQFTATQNGSNASVTWFVDGVEGGSSSIGSISTGGLYTAPGTPGAHQIKAVSTADSTVTATAVVNVIDENVNMTTYHNDPTRRGTNSKEVILTPANVNTNRFGKLASYGVDGQVYAQPLYVPNLVFNGTRRNVVFVATEHDSAYAFDADGSRSTPLWSVSLLGPGQSPASSSDTEGISPEIGITGTPVIDLGSNVLYVATMVTTSSGNQFWLHALDLLSGSERFGGPQRINPVVSGTGADSSNGKIALEGGCYQRPGLALANGNVYVSFGHCLHGWIVAFDANSLTQTAVFNSSPNGTGAAIWMSGGAPALDGSNSIYVITGVDANSTVNSGYSNAFLKLTPSLSLLDYFIPSNTAFLTTNDADLGSGSPVVLPDNSSAHPHEVVGAGKDGRIFLVDRDNMGRFSSTGNNVIQVVQSGTRQFDNFFDTPAYWNGNLYYHAENDVIRQFKWTNGLLSTTPSSKGPVVFGVHGATPSVSSNGGFNGIVWELQVDKQPTGPAVLHAYDATNVSRELYNSNMNSGDHAGPAVKFTVPTVVNGKVYVPAGHEVDIYGLIH